MTTKLAEPIIDALMVIVQGNLKTALAKVAADYPDAIPLPMVQPANFYFGERTTLGIREYPAMIFDVDQSGIDPEAFANQWSIYMHHITIDVLIKSDDEGVLARQLLRYARAVWEILYGNQVDTTAAGVAQAISVRPHTGIRSPLVPSGRAFLKGWRWVCEIHRYDDLT